MSSKVSPRLSQPLAPEVLELILSPRVVRELDSGFEELCKVNAAHLVMLFEKGFVDKHDAKVLAIELTAMLSEGPGCIQPDPALEDGYFNFEVALSRRAGASAGRLHLARSRNDINATLDKLIARRVLIEIIGSLIVLREALLDGAKAHVRTVMPGYTHMQPAQPTSFGFYLEGIAEALARDTARLFSAIDAAGASPMGACALAGTSFDIDRVRVCELLGFDTVHIHAQDAVTSRDYCWDIAAAALSTASTWGRFAQDLYIWSTHEFGLIAFDDSIAGTSSIMPQKKNPIAVEYLKGAAGEILGGATAMFAILKGGTFSHAGDTGRSSLTPMWTMLKTMKNALIIARVVVGHTTADRDRMKNRAVEGFATATELADGLVRESDFSFREAHHVVAELVRAAVERGAHPTAITIDDIEQAAEVVLGRKVSLPHGILEYLDPERSVEARRSQGAAGPAETEAMIVAAAEVLRSDGECLKRVAGHRDSADNSLFSRLRDLSESDAS